jgi:hypothetical protein
MHAEAERTDPILIPEMVAEVIQRHEARRRARRTAWQAHVKTAQAWRAGIERMAARGSNTHRRHRPRRRTRAVTAARRRHNIYHRQS